MQAVSTELLLTIKHGWQKPNAAVYCLAAQFDTLMFLFSRKWTDKVRDKVVCVVLCCFSSVCQDFHSVVIHFHWLLTFNTADGPMWSLTDLLMILDFLFDFGPRRCCCVSAVHEGCGQQLLLDTFSNSQF